MMSFITAMVACGSIASTVTIDEQTDGRVIQAAKGTTVVVRLQTQPGTGYAWRVRDQAENLVAVGAGTVEHLDAGTALTGGVDVQIFRFRVKSRGKSALRLLYVRPWEKDGAAARTFTVTIDSS